MTATQTAEIHEAEDRLHEARKIIRAIEYAGVKALDTIQALIVDMAETQTKLYKLSN